MIRPSLARSRRALLVSGLFGSLYFCMVGLAGASAEPAAGTTSRLSPSQSMNVVLVHGYLDTGRKLAAMRKTLESAGCRCLAPSLSPNDCRLGVRDLATKLSAEIEARFGPDEPIFIVGFSMGGLITRDYVQNLANRRRVKGVFLISTPNHGTVWARFTPNRKLRQLAVGSAFLTALNADDTAWQHIPVASYWTPLDLMILPATSSLWPVASEKRVWCSMHPLMVRNRQVIEDICAKIRALARTGARSGPSSHAASFETR